MLRRKAVFAEEAEDREKQSTEAVKEDCREKSQMEAPSFSIVKNGGYVTGDWSLGTTIGIRAKFESPESHQSDFGGERKPILNSDQIRSAQKWHLSIPPDSSRRGEAPAPNCVKIRRRTSPHAPPEVPRRGTTEEELTSEFQRKGQRRGPDKKVKERSREEVSRRRSQRSGEEHARDLYGWLTTRLLAKDSPVPHGRREIHEGDRGGAAVRHRPSGTSKKMDEEKQPLHIGTQSKRKVSGRSRVVQEYLEDPEGRVPSQADRAKPNRAKGRVPSEPTGQSRPCQGQTQNPFPFLHPNWGLHDTYMRRCRHFNLEVHSLQEEVKLPDDEGKVSQIQSCRSYRGAGPEVVRMDNLKTTDYPPNGLEGEAVFAEEVEDREKQSTEAVKEDCREVSDGGSLLLHCQEWGLYEFSHELICSSLSPINSEEGAGSEAMYLGGVVVLRDQRKAVRDGERCEECDLLILRSAKKSGGEKYSSNHGEGEKRETKSGRHPNSRPSPDAKQGVSISNLHSSRI
ncbi:hypothetical protein Acr_20g0007550 [Actinidia rufa]|uniref:Uncharacterized protein n=1 Tax=Actinidia rufa TaxID=165716 RepID=A0A7J0GDQ8_9ERIC|nr:hypothetical protein Acr_20g0007550 [Actinidia rufa]